MRKPTHFPRVVKTGAVLVRQTIKRQSCVFSIDIGLPAIDHERGRVTCAKPKPIEALIDTGAHGSAMNSELAKELGLEAHNETIITGFEGRPQKCPVASVYIRFNSSGGALKPLADVFQVALTPSVEDSPPFVIGMDILCLGRFTIDGPSGVWLWRMPHSSIEHLQVGGAMKRAANIRRALKKLLEEDLAEDRAQRSQSPKTP